MRFTANIPDYGDISVDGNFATEDTLKRLVSIMSSTKSTDNSNQKRANDQLADFSDTVDNSNRSLDEFSDELNRSEAVHSKVTAGLGRMANSVSNTVSRIAGAGNEAGGLGDLIAGAGESIGEAAQYIGGKLGGKLIGAGLETALTAFTGALGFAVGTLEEFSVYNRSVLNAGLGMAGGFQDITAAAQAAGLPIGQFTQALVENGDILRALSGGGPSGIKLVAGAFRSFTTETKAQLYAMGFTTEEIVGAMATYAEMAQRAGKDLTTEELAAGSEAYLKNLRELNRLTGVSVKEQLANQEAMRSDLFLRNQISQLPMEQQAAARSFIAALEPAAKAVQDFIVTGLSQTPESGQAYAMMPTYANALRQAYLDSIEQNLTEEEAAALRSQYLLENEARIRQEITAMERTYGATVAANMDAATNNAATLGGAMAQSAELTLNAAKGTADALDPDNIPPLDMAMGETVVATNELKSAIQSLTANGIIFALDQIRASLGGLTSISGATRETINDVSGLTDEYTTQAALPGTPAYDGYAGTLPGAVGSLERINDLAARFIANEDSLSSEEQQDLITALRGLQRSESYDAMGIGTGFGGSMLRGALDFLPDAGEVLGDLVNLDALLVSNADILGSIRNLGLGTTSGAVQNAFDTNNSPLIGASTDSLSAAPNRRSAFESAQTSAATTAINSDELLRVNKEMAHKMSMQLDQQTQIIKALQDQANISRNSAYARA